MGTAGTLNRKKLSLHESQHRVIESDRRFVLAAAGTGGGKTYVGPIWLWQEIAKHPTESFIIVAPTYKVLRDATIPSWMNIVRGTALEGEYKKSDGQYILPTGGVIYLASADKPDSIEGKHVKAIWADEAGQYDFWAWVVLQARVGSKLGRVLFTTTPYGLNWLFTEVYLRWKNGDPDYGVINWGTIDNPWYPKEEIDRARRTLSPEIFSMRYEGQFVRMEGLVYPDFHKWIVPSFTPYGECSWYGGLDFGFGNPTAKHDAALDQNDVLWVMNEYYKSSGLIGEVAESMRRDAIYGADPAGAQWIAELEAMGFDVRPANNDVEFGIQEVTARGRLGKLKIVRPECPALVDESETYHRDKKTGKPVKAKDHGMDGLRYLCNTVAAIGGHAQPLPPDVRLGERFMDVPSLAERGGIW